MSSVPPTQMGASEFKAHCLRILDEIAETGGEYLITKRGRPVARVISVTLPARTARGSWRGTVSVEGDIVHGDWASDFEATR